jgi:hypothetical protein
VNLGGETRRVRAPIGPYRRVRLGVVSIQLPNLPMYEPLENNTILPK